MSEAGDKLAEMPKPGREKTFDELEPAQQVQRLRTELIMLRELLSSQQALIERLMAHEHKADGSMVVPMHRSGIGMGLSGSGRRDNLR